MNTPLAHFITFRTDCFSSVDFVRYFLPRRKRKFKPRINSERTITPCRRPPPPEPGCTGAIGASITPTLPVGGKLSNSELQFISGKVLIQFLFPNDSQFFTVKLQITFVLLIYITNFPQRASHPQRSNPSCAIREASPPAPCPSPCPHRPQRSPSALPTAPPPPELPAHSQEKFAGGKWSK